MLLGKKNNDSNEKDDDNEILIMSYIQQSKFEEALDLLEKSNNNFFSSYNKILCLFFEGQLEKALEQIGKALSLLADNNNSSTDIDPLMLFEIGVKSLDGEQSYLDPISSKYAILFPNDVKNNLLRLQVDILAEQQEWDKVKEIVTDTNNTALLAYQNIQNALQAAKAQ